MDESLRGIQSVGYLPTAWNDKNALNLYKIYLYSHMNKFSLFEFQVKKACGNPTLLPSEQLPPEDATVMAALSRSSAASTLAGNKWVSPPSTEMLRFLVEINKSKDFYSKIIDR